MQVEIGDFLKRIRRPVEISADKDYRLVTVKLHHQGVVLRGVKKGSSIKSKMFKVVTGDFILSGIDARNGAFGIVPEELNGAVVTNDFWYFDVDESIIDRKLFLELTQTAWFDDICRKGSDGTTQRIRLQKDKFFNQEIRLPEKSKHEQLLNRILTVKQNTNSLSSEINRQQEYLSELRQCLLQDAIQGKLTEQWRRDNPNVESASELLHRIKRERESWLQLKSLEGYSEAKVIKRKFKKLEDNYIEILTILAGAKYVTDETYAYWSRRCPPLPGDILYTREAPVGETAIIPEGIRLCMGQRMMLLRPFHDLADNRFILYALMSPDFLNRLEDAQKGAMVKHLRVGDVENALIALPPLEEQKEIVAQVEILFEYCDELEKQILKSGRESEQLMQSILKEAFELGGK